MRREKKKKKNINNDLAILPSHNTSTVFLLSADVYTT